MYCPYCGNHCSEEHKYCFRCGKPLPEVNMADPAPEFLEEEVLEQTTPEQVDLPEAPTAVYWEQPYLTVETPLEEETEVPSEFVEESPAPKKGRLWPPLLALLLMICVGLTAYFIVPKNTVQSPQESCFTIEDGILSFNYSLYTGENELVIPDTVEGEVVTGIAAGCFADCDRLTTIILPETVTIIGDNAFAGCDSLRGIYFPDGVTSIGMGALSQCPALEAVYIPSTITRIGSGCFDDCTNLQYIFFDGRYSQWQLLYSGTFSDKAELHTQDGAYRLHP